MALSWLINGGDPNHLLTGMILQVLSIESWLVHRDPYVMVYEIIPI